MTISELIEVLQEQQEHLGPDVEVRIMEQPAWPFEYEVEGVVSRSEIRERRDPADDELDDEPEDKEPETVFILEGRQLCYGNKDAWE